MRGRTGGVSSRGLPEGRRELLRWSESLQRHGEAPFVVLALPGPQPDGRGLERREAGPPPELFGIDPVTAFHLAVLVRSPRLDVAVTNAPPLDGQQEGERELGASVSLQL